MKLFFRIKDNIGFLLICLFFGTLTIIALNVGDTGPPIPVKSEICCIAAIEPSYQMIIDDIAPVPETPAYTDTYDVPDDRDVYNPALDDNILMPRGSLVYYQTEAESVPNPADIIKGIGESKSWADLIGWESALYAFLILLGGWITPYVKWLNKIDSGVYRILVFAILVISGGLILGFGNVWQGAFAYFFSTSLYEVVIKLFVKSPKPSEVK